MSFDDNMKARAQREDCPIPEGFEQRIDALLNGLPAQAAPVKKRRPARIAVCAAVAAALVVGAGAAAPAVLSMARGAVDYFSGTQASRYGSQAEAYELYNAAVGVSQTVDGQTLTIDNIAVDDNYISIFYTLTGETAIEQTGTGDEPESWRARWSAPIFWAEVDGKELDTTGSIENDAYFVDGCTLRGMQRLPVKKALAGQFNLLLYTGGTSDKLDATFQFPFSIDKSAVECVTVEPALDFTADYSGVDELGDTYHVHRTPRIERVSVSPLSSSLTLSEAADNPWDSFVLRDGEGNYLPVLPGTLTGRGALETRVSNQFEFIGANKDTKSVTLVPITSSFYSHRVTGTLDQLPLTDGVENGLTLETLDVGADKAVATFSMRGAVLHAQADFELTDQNGDIVSFSDGSYIESTVDRESGLIIATLYYPSATAEEVAQVKGATFWQLDDVTLLEEQAVTVELE